MFVAVFFAVAICASSAMAHEVVKGAGWGGKPWQGLVWQGPTYGHKVDETNYSGPKANPIVVKNIGYGYDSHGYGYKDLYGYGGGYTYGYDDSYGYGSDYGYDDSYGYGGGYTYGYDDSYG